MKEHKVPKISLDYSSIGDRAGRKNRVQRVEGILQVSSKEEQW